jgi:hypothetical protein
MPDKHWSEIEYPPAVPKVCNDCPWRRVATPGWLGPHSAEEWIVMLHGETPIACHQTIVANEEGVGEWDHPGMRQCRGAAIMRANVAKSPRNPTVAHGPEDDETVFTTSAEFIAHHTGEEMTDEDVVAAMLRRKGRTA